MRTVAVRTRKDSVVLFGGSSFREDVGDAQVVGVRLDLTPSRSGRGTASARAAPSPSVHARLRPPAAYSRSTTPGDGSDSSRRGTIT